MPDETLPSIVEPTPLLLIQQALDAKYNPADLKDLFELQRMHAADLAERAYADAITGFQSECPPIRKNAANTHSGKRYADYEGVMRAIMPLLRKYKIVVTFDTADDGARMMTTCRVRVGTVEKLTTITLPLDAASKMMNATQAGGAAMSYGRRYALAAALNLVYTDEDTDAQDRHDAHPLNQCVGETPESGNVTPQQQADITAWLEELADLGVSINLSKFCKWAGGPECDSLSTIPAARYPLVAKDLEGRIATRKQAEAARKANGGAT